MKHRVNEVGHCQTDDSSLQGRSFSSLRNTFLYICVFFSYFQFVGPFPGTDLQPIFFLLAAVAIIAFMSRARLPTGMVIVLLISSILIIARILLFDSQIDVRYSATYLFSLLAILFFWCLFSFTRIGLSENFIFFVFIVYAGVGVVQFLYPDFMSWAVHRSELAALSYVETGRGVRSLTGEPAALGKVFSTLNVLYVLTLLLSDAPKRKYRIFVGSILFFLATLLISRSAYAIGIHFSLLSLLVFVLDKRIFYTFFLFSIIILVFIASFLVTYFESIQEIRAVSLFIALLNEPQVLLNQGAMRRVMNIPISINNLTLFGWVGSGNSSDVFKSSIWTPFGTLYYEAGARAIGGFVEFLLRFGLFSIPIMLLYFYMAFRVSMVKVVFNGRTVRIGIYFFAAILLLSFQDSSPALPMSLFMVVSLYCFRRELISH